MSRWPVALMLTALLVAPAWVSAQGRPETAALLAAQRAALRSLSAMDGTWRGKARIQSADGTWQELTQTERVGPMLDSTLKVIEGRGYSADGKVAFNAFAVLSWDEGRKAFGFRSHAQGFRGDFAFTPTDSGFVWEVPAGPMTIRYTATLRDGRWREVGDRVMPGREPVRYFEMDLVRLGPTDWPAGGAVAPR